MPAATRRTGSSAVQRAAPVQTEAAGALTAGLIALLGAVSAAATSSYATALLVIAPHADDLWGLRCAAAALRLAFSTGLFLRTTPLKLGRKLTANLLKLISLFALDVCALLPQPLFSTWTGGPFKLGDAVRAATQRVGRTVWVVTAPLSHIWLGAALLAALLVVRLLPRAVSKNLKHDYPRTAALGSTAVKALKAAALLAVFARLRAAVLYLLSGVSLTAHLAALPSAVFMGRQELAHFDWSFSPGVAWLMVAGDLAMSNPALPPAVGVSGAVLLGGAMTSAGVEPMSGFWLNASAWAAAAAADAYARKPEDDEDDDPAAPRRLEGRLGVVEVKETPFKRSFKKGTGRTKVTMRFGEAHVPAHRVVVAAALAYAIAAAPGAAAGTLRLLERLMGRGVVCVWAAAPAYAAWRAVKGKPLKNMVLVLATAGLTVVVGWPHVLLAVAAAVTNAILAVFELVASR